MSERPAAATLVDRASFDDCWNRIGVYGDGSCPELKAYVHCRNCPVFSAGAAILLDAGASQDYFADRTAHLAAPVVTREAGTQSVVIFRVGAEWLALPTPTIVEVANLLPVHSLPHRVDGVVLGLASVRGELLVCVSLGRIIGSDALAPAGQENRAVIRRSIVIRREAIRVVCQVDEVHGIHRFHPRDLQPLPASVAKAAVTYSTALLPWQGHSVGMLDDQLLFYTLKRSLA